MVELWLKFKDPSGDDRRVGVDKPRFTIGRHSANDLAIVDGRLSREHAVIERFGDIFVISDLDSSNGTEINGEKITAPTGLKSGDKLSLGGLDAELEFTDDSAESAGEGGSEGAAAVVNAPSPLLVPSDEGSGIPKAFFIIAPVFAVLILIALGALLFIGRAKPADTVNVSYTGDLDDPPKVRRNKDGNTTQLATEPSDIKTSTSTPGNANGTQIPNTPTADPAIAKTEANGSAFLRKIAQNDQRAFLIGEPAKTVYAKIKGLAGSSALEANIASARKNSAQIRSLAASKNLKPDLLAVAAITKLGNSTGDVVQTAQTMAGPLDRLSTQLSNELGEECLVIIAAYDQGAAGDFLKMRNILQDLATKMPDLARDIRTIWFLKKQGKISDAEYDFAVRFLAVGTVAQNPKDFGVNAEALSF